jgi:folate-binding protein YgfZ
MGLSALQIHGQGLRATRAGDYRGATTAACFGDPRQELAALRNGCGVYDLGYRAKISLTGSDRVRWLNGMVTNNIRDLAVGRGVYAFLLNPQGHILGDLYAYNRGESITVDTDCSQLDKVLATFDQHIIMDDVVVRNLSEELTALGVAGPKSREHLGSGGIATPQMERLQILDAKCTCGCDGTECTIVRGEDTLQESYELWVAPARVKELWDSLLATGATPVGFEALEMQRIVAGIPLYGVDIRERDLPQETEQARALNFNKGCYVGQEIVERIRSRGAVHRRLCGFTIENGALVAPGAKVSIADKEVGEITSLASWGDDQPALALGYIRREAGTPGKEVRIGATRALVAELPFRKM